MMADEGQKVRIESYIESPEGEWVESFDAKIYGLRHDPVGSDIERHLLSRHKELCSRFDHYTSPGNGAPGFVETIQRELRCIELALVAIRPVTVGKNTDS